MQRPSPVPPYFLEVATAHGVPVILSHRTTKDVYERLKPFIEAALAPSTNLHGSLADVYGVGLLFVGESGVGKSECVLDLVERGHRLVAFALRGGIVKPGGFVQQALEGAEPVVGFVETRTTAL